jgi:hypothetical protein
MSRPSRLPYVLAPGLLIVAALFAAQACGGGQVSEDPPPVCYLSQPVPDGGMVRNLRPNEWANLLVRSYNAGQTSSQNCVGSNIEWRPTDRECEVHEPEDEPAPQAVPITDESVIIGRSDTVAIKPVWVITHRFQDGDGFGPVAITERTAEGVSVRAIGTLRLPMERARLRLRETGGQRILVADGERCPSEEERSQAEQPAAPAQGQSEEGAEEAQPPTCLRSSRLLPVVGDEVRNPEVRNREGRCLGPALVHLSREHRAGLANGWERVFRLAASMEYRGGSIIVHEQVTAEDRDPRDPGRPARPFRTTDGDRVIQLERGGMRSEGIPLFDRTIRARGSTQLPVAESEENGGQSGSGRERAAPK